MHYSINQLKEKTEKDMTKDTIMSILFIAGIFGFISGEFILSTLLFATAAISSNIASGSKRSKISE